MCTQARVDQAFFIRRTGRRAGELPMTSHFRIRHIHVLIDYMIGAGPVSRAASVCRDDFKPVLHEASQPG